MPGAANGHNKSSCGGAGLREAVGTRRKRALSMAKQYWSVDVGSDARFNGQRGHSPCVADDGFRKALATIVDRSR